MKGTALLITPIGVGSVYLEKRDVLRIMIWYPIYLFVLCLILVLGYLAPLDVFLIVFLFVLMLVCCIEYVVVYKEAIKRAKFINEGGVYKVLCESVVYINGDGTEHNFKTSDTNSKVQPRKNRVDITFGKSFSNRFKHFGSDKHRGFGLYSIDAESASKACEILEIQK